MSGSTAKVYAGSRGARRARWRRSGRAQFAGVLMIVNGVIWFFAGLMAVLHEHIYVATPNYLFQFDILTWGWINLVIGALVAFVGMGVLGARSVARYAGMVLASLAILSNFAFLPYYPLWCLVALAINLFIIWALATCTE